jgi:hypothetical protein
VGGQVSIYVSVGVDIDASHKLNKFSCLSLVVSTVLVEVFANKIEQFFNFRAFEIRDSLIFYGTCHEISTIPHIYKQD